MSSGQVSQQQVRRSWLGSGAWTLQSVGRSVAPWRRPLSTGAEGPFPRCPPKAGEAVCFSQVQTLLPKESRRGRSSLQRSGRCPERWAGWVPLTCRCWDPPAPCRGALLRCLRKSCRGGGRRHWATTLSSSREALGSQPALPPPAPVLPEPSRFLGRDRL